MKARDNHIHKSYPNKHTCRVFCLNVELHNVFNKTGYR